MCRRWVRSALERERTTSRPRARLVAIPFARRAKSVCVCLGWHPWVCSFSATAPLTWPFLKKTDRPKSVALSFALSVLSLRRKFSARKGDGEEFGGEGMRSQGTRQDRSRILNPLAGRGIHAAAWGAHPA